MSDSGSVIVQNLRPILTDPAVAGSLSMGRRLRQDAILGLPEHAWTYDDVQFLLRCVSEAHDLNESTVLPVLRPRLRPMLADPMVAGTVGPARRVRLAATLVVPEASWSHEDVQFLLRCISDALDFD
jgi:hypothetical protein